MQKNEKKLKNILMASFQAKTGLARLRKRKKKLSFRSMQNRPGIENSKKIAKKLKKLKNIIMPSFQAKMGRESLRTRKKNYRSDQLLPDPEYKIPKK